MKLLLRQHIRRETVWSMPQAIGKFEKTHPKFCALLRGVEDKRPGIYGVAVDCNGTLRLVELTNSPELVTDYVKCLSEVPSAGTAKA